jgi:serine/threonine protein kinase
MDYIKGGELFDYVQARVHLPEDEVRCIMLQMLHAVAYLHQQGVVHRDLKLENILRDGDGRIFLSDFGFATEFSDNPLETACGSPCYAAPELVLDKQV